MQSIVRAWMVGCVLIVMNCYWLIQMESLRRAFGATFFSLFFNAVFTLWVLFLLNRLLRRFTPKLAFDNRELLTIYIMVNMVSSLCSYTAQLTVIPHVITYPFWGATPENDWRQLFHKDLPQWLVVNEPSVLIGYYRGEANLYTARHLTAWLPPLLWWSFFTLVLIFVMLCINIIIRRQWIEHEKLAYPIAEIPLTLVQSGGYSRMMWIGFAIAAGINIVNGLHFLYPSFPGLTFVQFRHIGYIFTEEPWNALWAMRVSFIPSIIGLSFFMPLDVLFSCWFFYLYWQAMRVVGAFAGWHTYPGYGRHVYIVQESVGAYCAVLAIAIWRAARHMVRVRQQSVIGSREREMDDAPMSYVTAWCGMICGMIVLMLFCYKAGMTMGVAIGFVLFYYYISTCITRLRAEFGFPLHDVHFGGPIQMITSAFGTANLSQRTLVAMPFFWHISRIYLSHIMPHQLEGFKIASRSRVSPKRAFWSMLLACAFGIVVIFWLLLHLSYHYGLENTPYPRWGAEVWFYLQDWLRNPTEVDYIHMALMGLGVVVASFLAFLRARFVWWPLHPMGYALGGSFGMSFLWTCLLVAWILKWFILRYGGIIRYRQFAPLFLGLILGEFSVTGIWTILGLCLNWPELYNFWHP